MEENKMACIVRLDFGEHNSSQPKKHRKALRSYIRSYRSL